MSETRPSATGPRWSGQLGRLGLFGGFTALIVGFATSQALSSGLARVVVPMSLAIALQFFSLFWSERADPFEPASFHGIYNALGLTSSLVAYLARDKVSVSFLPGVSQTTIEEIVATIAWAYVVGTIAYLLGYYSRLGRRAEQIFPTRLSNLDWSPTRTTVAMVICVLIAIPPYAVFQSRVGAGLLDITQLKAGKEALLKDDDTAFWITRGIMIGLLPAMFVLALAARRRVVGGMLPAIAAVVLSALLVLRLGQRGYAIFFLATCGAIYHYLRRRIPVGPILGAIFLLVVASNVLGEYRITDDPRLQRGVSAQRFDPTEALQELETDRGRMSSMAVVWHTFPDRHEYLLGESWYAIVATPIPRSLWPGKADAFQWRETRIMIQLRGQPIPIPYLGLLYANFSWVGIVIGMALWGVFQRGLYEWLKTHERDPSTVLLYSNFLIVSSPTVFAMNWAILFVLPVAIVLLFIGFRRRPAVATSRVITPAADGATT